MNRTLSNLLLFTAGAALGSLVTWRIFKSRYEIVDEDYDEEPDDSVEDDAGNKSESTETKIDYNKKPPLKDYVKMVEDYGYKPKTHMEEVKEELANGEQGDEDIYEPFIIRPEEYGELHAYETLSQNPICIVV